MQEYRYVHSNTEATTGYFTCEPHPRPDLGQALLYLQSHPLDSFMRRYLLTHLVEEDPQSLRTALHDLYPGQDVPAPVSALLEELALLREDYNSLAQEFPDTGAAQDSDPASPLIFLRWKRLPDRILQEQWRKLFRDNIRQHKALKRPGETGLPALYPASAEALTDDLRLLPGLSSVFTSPFSTHISELHQESSSKPSREHPLYVRPPAEETADQAERRLKSLDIIAGSQMRHNASLSPVALLRPWNVKLVVREDRHELSLSGKATTYGRGLSLAAARASCLMEMVERASAYLSVEDDRILHLAEPNELLHGSRSTIEHTFGPALDPGEYPLEVPYRDAPLCWLRGTSAAGGDVRVPVQMAGLFSNLDEIDLFDSPGSTGIATGNSVEEAKLAALLEVIERDAEATTPFAKTGCFVLEADPGQDPLIARLLDDYKARGINVQFQDITGPMGVPVFQCFVMSPKGAIARGYGAGLSAKKAVISALTETPYPYPDGEPSGPLLRKLPVKKLHELPDYSLGSPSADSAMLEELLIRNGRTPVYVNLTRTGLDFPVIRALVPGMELASDSDAFSRVPWRLYLNYLRLFAGDTDQGS